MLVSFEGLFLVDYCEQSNCLILHYESGMKIKIAPGAKVQIV